MFARFLLQLYNSIIKFICKRNHNIFRRAAGTQLYAISCRYLPNYTKSVLSRGRCSVSVWGAISKDGLGPLVRLEGPFTASRYCDVITRHLVPYALDGPFSDGCYFFQHDRSPIHKARIVQSLLEEHAVCQLEWPPCMWRRLESHRKCLGHVEETAVHTSQPRPHGRYAVASDRTRMGKPARSTGDY